MGDVLIFPAQSEVEQALPLAAGAEGFAAAPPQFYDADIIELKPSTVTSDNWTDGRTPSLVENLPQEEAARFRFASFLGETCVKQALETDPKLGHASGQTLAKSIVEAKNGDEDAMRRVDINVSTATSEGYFKQGHFRRSTKTKNADGEVSQFGLTIENMHRDSIVLRPDRPRGLKEFTLAEARNGFREQELVSDDRLKNSWFIVASCVPEDLPEEQLDHRGDGYFTRSMTFSLQGTTQEGSDVVTEIVFDKGTDASENADYAMRQSERFDIAAIRVVYEKLGLPAPKSALEMLQTPIEVPKRYMPNGMVDFWRWVDEAADELHGKSTVRTEEEYITRIDESREREESLAGTKEKIKAELLDLDGKFEEDHDIRAIEALWELVRKYGPKEAVKNIHIDPIVFGPEAAERIYQARRFMSVGDEVNAMLWIQSAEEVATIAGCGGGCGLADANSEERKFAKDRMHKKSNEIVVKDLKRPCVKCGEMTAIYVYVKDDLDSLVKKGCTNNKCGATENV